MTQQQRILQIGLLATTWLAILKTAAVSTYLGGLAGHTRGELAVLFATLWLLTALVALAAGVGLRHAAKLRRKASIPAPVSADPGKENMMEHHAKVWGLTKAETDVAIMVVKGFSNAEIAAMRNSALQTVKTQLSAIYQKSGLEGRYQLLAFVTDEVCETSRATCDDLRQRALVRGLADNHRNRSQRQVHHKPGFPQAETALRRNH